MNVAWNADGADVEQGTPVANHPVPEDQTAHGPPLESSLKASVPSTLTGSKSHRARRSAMLAFEQEMKQFSDQVCLLQHRRRHHACGAVALFHVRNRHVHF